MKGFEKSGIYHNKAAAQNGADWWRARGYNVRVQKVKGGYIHWRKKKKK